MGHEGSIWRRQRTGADELIGSATRRLKRYKPDTQAVVVELPEQPISLYVHPALIEQAIFNVLEKCRKTFHLQIRAKVMIRTYLLSEDEVKKLKIKVGIPEDERHRIFDMFLYYGAGRPGVKIRWLGLGLTIWQVRLLVLIWVQ